MLQPFEKLRSQTKICIWIIIIGLALSGLTAFPLETEIAYLLKHTGAFPIVLQNWLLKVYEGIKNSNIHYPFLSYGTDWLAFAHLMLAILFVGPLKDPIKNKWVVEFGIICCISIIPLALIAGNIRQIPLFWRCIDCAFGVLGIIPLLRCHINIKQMEIYTLNQKSCIL